MLFSNEVHALGTTLNVTEYDRILQQLKSVSQRKAEKFISYMEKMPLYSWRALDWILNDQRLVALDAANDHHDNDVNNEDGIDDNPEQNEAKKNLG